jgi:ribose transport system substrate-binding protein
VHSLRNPFSAAIARGATAEARRIGPGVQVAVVADEYSALTQADQIDAFVAGHVDVIVLTPADPQQIAEAIGRARAAGVVVVTVGGPAVGADAQVASDDVAAGALACGALVQALGGHGQVAILGGPPRPATTARDVGCADALARSPDIHVGLAAAGPSGPPDGSRESARRAMRDLFAAGPVDAVFTVNDAEALGAADTAAEIGRATLVASAEGSPVIEAALASRARTNIIASAASDPYAMGGAAVHVANELRNGREPNPEQRLLDPALVTRDTVHDYKGWLAERE